MQIYFTTVYIFEKLSNLIKSMQDSHISTVTQNGKVVQS